MGARILGSQSTWQDACSWWAIWRHTCKGEMVTIADDFIYEVKGKGNVQIKVQNEQVKHIKYIWYVSSFTKNDTLYMRLLSKISRFCFVFMERNFIYKTKWWLTKWVRFKKAVKDTNYLFLRNQWTLPDRFKDVLNGF